MRPLSRSDPAFGGGFPAAGRPGSSAPGVTAAASRVPGSRRHVSFSVSGLRPVCG